MSSGSLEKRSRFQELIQDSAELFRNPIVGPFSEELLTAHRETMLSRTQVLIWMGVVVMPTAIWGFTGYFKPDSFGTAVGIVLAAIVAVLLLNVFIKRGSFDKHYHLPLTLTVGGVFGPVAASILALTRESDGNYLFAYFLIYFAFTSLFPASAGWLLFTSAMVIGTYVAVFLAIIPTGFDATMVSNILYMLELTFIGLILNRVICKLFFDEKRIRLELRDANAGLRELDQAKTQFFSNMNHELRTLLTLILTPLNVALQRKDLPQGLTETLIGIRSNAAHLLKTVNLLLDVSRLEAGQVHAKLAEVQIDDLIRYTGSLFEGAATHKGLKLVIDDGIGLLAVRTDIDKVEQILVNLLGNAFKFTPDGGTVTLSSRREGDWMVLSVTDSGVGIAPEDQKLIFQRFGQVEGAQKVSVKGTGIGLSMVREYTNLLGGKVELESTVGVGSTFSIRLPVVEPERSEAAAQDLEDRASAVLGRELATADLYSNKDVKVSKRQACGDINAPWILTVDDNPSLLRLVGSILGDHYNLYRASSGEEALEVLAEHRIDMVISDVMMPGITGLELCGHIKSSPETQMIPVILLTARGETSEKIEGLGVGADDYIGKPFDPDELRARVSGLFERQQLVNQVAEKSVALQAALDDLKAEGVKLVASEKMRTLGDLAAGIFHELHNYMNMLYNGAQPLQDLISMVHEEPDEVTDEDIAEIKELADLITDAAEASLAITGELKIYAHQTANDIQRVDIHEVIRSNVRLFGKLDSGLEVNLNFDDSESVLIDCVPSRMLMVFTNMVKNSFEAMEHQGTVTIETRRTNGGITIEVSDTGTGIPDSFRSKLFEPFQTTKPSGKGLGLGLSLASKVVAELHGQIRYDDSYASGAKFVIELPTSSAHSAAA